MSLKDIIKIGQYYQNKYIDKFAQGKPDVLPIPDRLNANLLLAQKWQKTLPNNPQIKEFNKELNALLNDFKSGKLNISNDASKQVTDKALNEVVKKYTPILNELNKGLGSKIDSSGVQGKLLSHQNKIKLWMDKFPDNPDVQNYHKEISDLIAKVSSTNMPEQQINSELNKINSKYINKLVALTGQQDYVKQQDELRNYEKSIKYWADKYPQDVNAQNYYKEISDVKKNLWQYGTSEKLNKKIKEIESKYRNSLVQLKARENSLKNQPSKETSAPPAQYASRYDPSGI